MNLRTGLSTLAFLGVLLAAAAGCQDSTSPECSDATQCPDPGTECVLAACTSGTCGTAPAPAGTACASAGGAVCDASGHCVACNVDVECVDPGAPFCVDGVCCDTACGASCQACTAAKKGSGVDGVCGSITAGTDPDAECGAEPAASCGNVGGCDGAGACRKYDLGTVCRAAAGDCDLAELCPGGGAACPVDVLEVGAVCRDSTGACDPAETCTGASAVCPVDTTLCGGACGGCSNGEPCAADADCLSGMCYGALCVGSINACNVATATDLTAVSAVTITFPNAGFTYAPPCIKVAAGTAVQFVGAFGLHPLLGGEVAGGVAVPASGGPFVPATISGTTRTFTLSSAGTFPYYCTAHFFAGMAGAVFVVP